MHCPNLKHLRRIYIALSDICQNHAILHVYDMHHLHMLSSIQWGMSFRHVNINSFLQI